MSCESISGVGAECIMMESTSNRVARRLTVSAVSQARFIARRNLHVRLVHGGTTDGLVAGWRH